MMVMVMMMMMMMMYTYAHNKNHSHWPHHLHRKTPPHQNHTGRQNHVCCTAEFRGASTPIVRTAATGIIFTRRVLIKAIRAVRVPSAIRLQLKRASAPFVRPTVTDLIISLERLHRWVAWGAVPCWWAVGTADRFPASLHLPESLRFLLSLRLPANLCLPACLRFPTCLCFPASLRFLVPSSIISPAWWSSCRRTIYSTCQVARVPGTSNSGLGNCSRIWSVPALI